MLLVNFMMKVFFYYIMTKLDICLILFFNLYVRVFGKVKI